MDTLTLTYAATLSIDWMLKPLEAIKTELGVEIKVLPGIQNHSSLFTENPIIIEITGDSARIELARVQVLTRINEIVVKFNFLSFMQKKINFLTLTIERVQN